jgi:uncharacterized protein (TIGR04141 family)
MSASASRRRSTAPVHKTTLYRLDRAESTVAGLSKALNRAYVEEAGFTVLDVDVGGTHGVLAHGTVPQTEADWCAPLSSLAGRRVSLGHSNSGAALLVTVDEQVFALTYGTLGRYLVNLGLSDPTFGLAFAIRTVPAESIKNITRRAFGRSGRLDRSLVPGGQHIRHYGIERYNEIVGQLSGTLRGAELTATTGGRTISVAGAESLHIELANDPAALLADLREIGRTRDKKVDNDLAFIDEIKPLESDSDEALALDARLDTELGEPATQQVSLAVPLSCFEHVDAARSFRIRVPHSGVPALHRGSFDIDTILRRTSQCAAGHRLSSLRTGQVTMYKDGDANEQIGPGSGADRWITAELPDGGRVRLYQEGRWYELGAGHVDTLREEIQALLDRSTTTLPRWTMAYPDEKTYNEEVGKTAGFLCLDRKLVKSPQHDRGIEICDLLGPNDELIHVKKAASSGPLSHLFNQGLVSADALLYEPDTRDAFLERVWSVDPQRDLPDGFRPHKVVYAVALASGKPVDTSTLFTFAQSALYRAMRALRLLDIEVELVSLSG